MQTGAKAFLSYVRMDDAHEEGKLGQIRERISGEVRLQTGDSFEIFQDRNDIAWGQAWQQRIDESLDAATFLIPVITPGFFKSPHCRQELQRFLDRERALGRQDLVLPLYYVEARMMSDEAQRAQDPLAAVIAQRQLADLRELRFEPLTTPAMGRQLAKMARHIVEALERVADRAGATSGPAVKASAPAEGAGGRVSSPAPAQSQPLEAAVASQPRPAGAPPAKTQPPILVVDAMHRGDHASIGAALKGAKPGTRILVRAGHYAEGLVVDKPVEIIGDAEPGEVVVEAKGAHVVLFKTTMGRIANLTLRQRGGGEWYGVDIAQGRLELEDCDITSASLSCVAIHGEADPRLRRNRIHDGKDGGVFCYEDAQGTLEDNEVFANALHGVSIIENANPTLRRNRIHDGKGGGISVYAAGQGVIEDNDIFSNAKSGVSISEAGQPTLRRNRIHDGGSSGVFCYANAQGTLEDNDIFGNKLSGVAIKDGANPTLRRNRIHGGKAGGVFVYASGHGTIEDNDIVANVLAGVEIKGAGNPTLRSNRIRDGLTGGVFVHTEGLGTIEDNDIASNKGDGIVVEDRGRPVVRGNRVTGNLQHGVRIAATGAGTFENNDLRHNAKGPWKVAVEAEPQVLRSRNRES